MSLRFFFYEMGITITTPRPSPSLSLGIMVRSKWAITSKILIIIPGTHTTFHEYCRSLLINKAVVNAFNIHMRQTCRVRRNDSWFWLWLFAWDIAKTWVASDQICFHFQVFWIERNRIICGREKNTFKQLAWNCAEERKADVLGDWSVFWLEGKEGKGYAK